MIVGLAGYAGAGKDTAAQALINLGWRQDAFAAPLKAIALELEAAVETYAGRMTLGRWVGQVGWEEAKRLPEVRRLLQSLGASVRTNLGEGVWVTAMHQRWLDASCSMTVVTDVRYENEANWVLQFGQTRYSPRTGRPLGNDVGPRLIWIDRPGVGPVNDHPSDQGLVRPMCTHVLVNDGTPEQLWCSVLDIVGVPA